MFIHGHSNIDIYYYKKLLKIQQRKRLSARNSHFSITEFEVEVLERAGLVILFLLFYQVKKKLSRVAFKPFTPRVCFDKRIYTEIMCLFLAFDALVNK